ncbi:hypothetical protein HOC35_04460 [Candidatus Woesearchaeota archaeon]|nr:hypothetical protein [Candidatus Woesearchaeota archaeon]
MTKKIVIYGSGGSGREVKMFIDQINEHYNNEDYKNNQNNENKKVFEIIGFIDDNPEKKGTIVVDNLKIIGDFNYLLNYNDQLNVVIAIGEMTIRKSIFDKIKQNTKLKFPNIIHPSVIYEKKTSNIGKGNIISSGAVISTNFSCGDFNHIHLNAAIGHDFRCGDYCNLFPGINIAGMVKMHDFCEIGLGSSIRQCIEIPTNVRVAGCSFIMRNPEPNYSYIGVPIRKFFKLKEIK